MKNNCSYYKEGSLDNIKQYGSRKKSNPSVPICLNPKNENSNLKGGVSCNGDITKCNLNL